ncbi:MAG TPA: bile acid:sodium symporter family protein [Chthoniobacterales bacterium]
MLPKFIWKPDWFMWGMAAAVALAWIFPNPGAHGGFLHPEILNKIGVALIFFLNGVSLSFTALKSGMMRWPVHVVVQLCTFVLFPIAGLLLNRLGDGHLAPGLQLGIFYLCALPSTVSSSVAMTAAARGNVPAAVFNATLSSVIGVFITPLWLGLAIHGSSGNALPLGKVILDLCIWLILPLVLGQLSRPWLAAWATRNKRGIHFADRGTILLLIYTSFCDSVKWGVWSAHSWNIVVLTIAGSVLLFFAIFAVVRLVCVLLRFPFPDRIATVFCGSKKSLASGIPMAQIIFAGNPELSLILLPIMIYHPLQLVICSILAGHWAKRPLEKPSSLEPQSQRTPAEG